MTDYRRQLYSDYSANFAGSKSGSPQIQFRQYARCYRRLPPATDARILDAGCGKGEWLNWLRGRGYTDLWGFDLSAADLELARRNPSLNLEEGDAISLLEKRPAFFDLIHAKDVIEHLTPEETLKFLNACKNALKPGGELWLLTFNAQSPFAAATRYGDFTHQSGFTPASMLQVLKASGLQPVEVRGIHITPNTLNGRMRKLIWRICTPVFRTMLKARHGAQHAENADLLSTDPDLFAIARAD